MMWRIPHLRMTKNDSSLEAACGPESLFLIRIYLPRGGYLYSKLNFAVAAKNYVTVYITGRLSVVDLFTDTGHRI